MSKEKCTSKRVSHPKRKAISPPKKQRASSQQGSDISIVPLESIFATPVDLLQYCLEANSAERVNTEKHWPDSLSRVNKEPIDYLGPNLDLVAENQEPSGVDSSSSSHISSGFFDGKRLRYAEHEELHRELDRMFNGY